MSRRRWVYTNNGQPCEPYEVGTDWTPPAKTEFMLGGHYAGARALDGTPIDTRAKHQEYMRRNNLAVADDFKGQWAQQAKEREAFHLGKHDRKERREAIERVIHSKHKP